MKTDKDDVYESLIACDVPAFEGSKMAEREGNKMAVMNGVAISTAAHLLRLCRMVGLNKSGELGSVASGVVNIALAGASCDDDEAFKTMAKKLAEVMEHMVECENCRDRMLEDARAVFNGAYRVAMGDLKAEVRDGVPAGVVVH